MDRSRILAILSMFWCLAANAASTRTVDADALTDSNHTSVWFTRSGGGTVVLKATDAYGAVHFESSTGTGEASFSLEPGPSNVGGTGQWILYTNGSNLNSPNDFAFYDSQLGASVFNLISATGYLGIGTNNPSQRLEVNGNAQIDGTLSMNSNQITSVTDPTTPLGAANEEYVDYNGGVDGEAAANGGGTYTMAKSTGLTLVMDLSTSYTDDNQIVALPDATTLQIGTAVTVATFAAFGQVHQPTYITIKNNDGSNYGGRGSPQVYWNQTIVLKCLDNSSTNGSWQIVSTVPSRDNADNLYLNGNLSLFDSGTVEADFFSSSSAPFITMESPVYARSFSTWDGTSPQGTLSYGTTAYDGDSNQVYLNTGSSGWDMTLGNFASGDFTTGNSGNLNIYGQGVNSSTGFTGSTISVQAGNGNGASDTGGNVNVYAGSANGSTAGSGGNVTLGAGNSASASGTAGTVTIVPGSPSGTITGANLGYAEIEGPIEFEGATYLETNEIDHSNSPYSPTIQYDQTISVDTTAGAVVINLPSDGTLDFDNGLDYLIIDTGNNAATHNITINAASGDTFSDGTTVKTVNTNNGWLEIAYLANDNDNVWSIINQSSGGGSSAPTINGSAASPQSVTASGITLSTPTYFNVVFIAGSSSGTTTVTGTPSITACTAAGQELKVISESSTNLITLQNNADLSGSRLLINGPWTSGKNDGTPYTITFLCDGAVTPNWVETARSN